ncbi:hypothetical protein OC845_005010 [Tilletia horrida]|nr:hypothetical protein OC845_005010 [Tilletia horrida]
MATQNHKHIDQLRKHQLAEASHVPSNLRLVPISSGGKVHEDDAKLDSPLTLMALYISMIQPVTELLGQLCRGTATDPTQNDSQTAWPPITRVVSSPFIFFGPGAIRAHAASGVRWTTLIDMSVSGCIVTQRLAEAAVEEPPAQIDGPDSPALLQNGVEIGPFRAGRGGASLDRLADDDHDVDKPRSIQIGPKDLINVFGELQLSVKSPTVGLATGFRKLFIDSDDILLNTTASLDGALSPLLQTRLSQGESTAKELYSIGPIDLALPAYLSPKEAGGSEDASGTRSFLDSQSARSVLYVAFGSLARLPDEELVKVVEALKQNRSIPFILVSRPVRDALDDPARAAAETTSSFGRAVQLLRTMIGDADSQHGKKRALVLGWAPQRLVLAHPSTGLFLSHAGWNSSLESLSSGVPMLLRPFGAEQMINARMLSDYHKVAVRIDASAGAEEEPEGSAQTEQWPISAGLRAFVGSRLGGGGEEAVLAKHMEEMSARAERLGRAIRKDASGLEKSLTPSSSGNTQDDPVSPGSSADALRAWISQI